MAVTIVNPARFNDDGLGTRRFIRAAFFDEGYGVSTSFLAYAQGAGIVPSTADFNAVGAGTAGDPLRMSQFSGFVVPKKPFFTTSLTEGFFSSSATNYKSGYARDTNSGFAPLGSVSTATISGSSQFVEFATSVTPFKSGTYTQTLFVVTGDQRSAGWTSVTLYSSSFVETYSLVYSAESGLSASFASGKTTWLLLGGAPSWTGAGAVKTFSITA